MSDDRVRGKLIDVSRLSLTKSTDERCVGEKTEGGREEREEGEGEEGEREEGEEAHFVAKFVGLQKIQDFYYKVPGNYNAR